MKVGWAFAVLAKGWELARLGNQLSVWLIAITALITDSAESALDSKEIFCW